MTTSTFPIIGHIALAERFKAMDFLFALSRGNPAWDSQWASINPPTPPIETVDVLDVFGYARPVLVEFVRDDPSGQIISTGGGKFSPTTDRTRYVRIRLALPVSSFQGETVREIGIYASPSIDPTVPPGDVVIAANRVADAGDLMHVHWRPAYDLEEGDFFARNFILKV